MNYLKIYNNLVDTRKQKYQQAGYYELHHIVPKCLGGTKDVRKTKYFKELFNEQRNKDTRRV